MATDMARVLVLYTGGTIGMREGPRGYEPAPGFLLEQLRRLPQFHDPAFAELTTPPSRYGKRVHYVIREYAPLVDSANMGLSDWARLATDIADHYDHWDAFVVLHGTDTMSYSASALSFMVENLGKTVILTGAQIPLHDPRSDGQSNLLGALTIAGHFEIPEVCLYFHHKLFRGNRTTKADALGFDAFVSGNFPPLVEAGVELDVRWPLVLTPTAGPLQVHTTMSPHVAALRLFPGLDAGLLRHFLQPPLEGAVLETYGAGNAPDNRPELLKALRDASDAGVVIVNCSQCQKGRVKAHYASGAALGEAGVVPGADMTAEAALTKLGWLIGRGLGRDEIVRQLQCNVRGELTRAADRMQFSFREQAFVQSVARAMVERMDEQLEDGIQRAVTPVLLCAAASLGDIGSLQVLLRRGVDVDSANYDGRTALHLAASEGHVACVRFLLDQEADPGVVDRWGNTPLDDAVRSGHVEVTTLLRASAPA